jgi:hypothetical protein
MNTKLTAKRLIIHQNDTYQVLFLPGLYKTLDRAILAVYDHENLCIAPRVTPWITTAEKTIYKVEF